MAIVSKSVQRIKASVTMALAQKARELKQKGKDVISLGAGEPDFAPPEHVLKATIKAVQSGKNKYTAVDGIIELKQAIKHKFLKDNQIDCDLNQIMVTAGGKQAIYNAMVASLDVGDEVIIPAPYWVSYPEMVLLSGATPVIVTSDAENGFKLTKKQLQNAITAKTKWLIINSPGNPSGAVYSKDELRALSDVLLDNPHVNVISDDIYEHIIFDDDVFYTIAQVEPRLKERVLTVNGVSKAYSLTGLRIGYCVGVPKLIAAMTKVQSQSTSNPASISQYAALAALGGDQSFLKETVKIFQRRRDLVVQLLNQTPYLSCDCPKGAFYAYVDCSEAIGKKTADGVIINNDEDFSMQLLQVESVAVVFGAAFGLSPFFRLSYAEVDELLVRACDRIKRFCGKLR